MNSKEDDKTLIIEHNNRKAEKCLIWWHGMGESPETAARFFQDNQIFEKVDNFRFIFPRAKEMSIFENSAPISSWFNIIPNSDPKKTGIDLDSFENSLKKARGLIAIEISSKRHKPIDVILGGYSQGAPIAISAGMTCPHPISRILSVAGYVVPHDSLRRISLAKHLPFFDILHGDKDANIPLGRAIESYNLILGQEIGDIKLMRGQGHTLTKTYGKQILNILKRLSK